MRQGQYVITYRKRRRTRPRSGLWAALAVMVLALGAGGVVLAQARSSADAASPAALTPTPTAAPAHVQPAAGPVVRPVSSEPAGAAADGSATVPAEKKSSKKHTEHDPVAAAAVEFPDAPSVKPKSIASLKPKHKYVAITFDDGYGYDPKTLRLLQQYDARCTTFLLGEWMSRNKKVVRKLHKAGFEIANHTWDHKNLTNLSDAQIRSELTRTQEVISSVTGNQAPYMRPPGGATDARVKAIAGDLGYKVVMWSRSFADSSPKASPQRAYRSVMTRSGGVRPGDIIVCHWGSEDTYEALKRILPELKAQGYEFVTVSELIADSKNSK